MRTATKGDDLINLDLIGKTFKLDGDSYKFTKYMFKAKSNPVVAVRISDGVTHRFESVQVARAFQGAA